MAENSDLALVGATGKAYVAAKGSTGPVSMASLDTAFHELGWISDDGLTEARNEDSKSWTPWGSLSPIRTEITSSQTSFKITCWETNEEVLRLYYRTSDADVTPDVSTKLISFAQSNSPTPDRRAFVFDVLDGTNHLRFYVPDGEVTARGDIVYKKDELVGYEMTITAYPGTDSISIHRMYLLDAYAA